MEAIQLPQLWTVGAVLAGFQVAALTWRINREVSMETEDETTWVTLADGFVAASFLVLIIAVFLAPLSESTSTQMAAKWLGIALMLFTASPFVLAGHYNLYCSWDKNRCRPRVTKQEGFASVVSIILVGCGAWWILG